MTEKEIRNLKKGDVICWPREGKGYMAYGIIEFPGTLYCSAILGDGDSNINEDDIFVASEPGWLESYDIVKLADDETARLVRIINEKGQDFDSSIIYLANINKNVKEIIKLANKCIKGRPW